MNDELEVNEKTVVVDEQVIIDRMIMDIRASDSDALECIIESMYPVKVAYEDGLISITVDESQVSAESTLKDIF